MTREQKLEIVESLCNKNLSESQQQVAAFFEVPVRQVTQQKIQADESVRVELTLSKEAFAKVKKAQELLSHSVTTQDLSQFLEFLAEKVIQQKTSIGKSKATATVAVKSMPSMKDLKLLRTQQGCCQYVDPLTGRKCQSTWKLQVDHKQSRWAGGTHDLNNLQQLCAGHNKLKYRKEVWIRYN